MAEITARFDARTRNSSTTPVRVRVFDSAATEIDFQDGLVGEEFHFNVDGTGLYRVRAELPSGELLDSSVRLQNEDAKGEVEIESHDSSSWSDLAWAYTQQGVGVASGFDSVSSSLTGTSEADIDIMEGVRTNTASRIVQERSLIIPGVLAFEQGSLYDAVRVVREEINNFDVPSWARSDAFSILGKPTALLSNSRESLPTDDGRLLGRLFIDTELIQAKRQSGNSHSACIPYTVVQSGSPAKSQSGCVLVPGTGKRVEVVFVSVGDTESTSNDANPWTRALVRTGNDNADALMAYLKNSSVWSAKVAGDALLNQADELLYGKVKDPVSAVVAGYFLLQAGMRKEHTDWLRNLADWFPGLPDGAIIYGSYCLREGRVEEASKYLKDSINHGVPVYTFGLRLLLDGLRRVSDFARTKSGRPSKKSSEVFNVEGELEKVRLIAAYADWESQTTAFSL